ncbi:MAG TPA: efflux RND transporter periplasmic adaptor subunit [Kofleriaceae bacterium]|nr:efflux RND transporter periplasmic adaptor subunit [Kofleriaceae bacterium]
MAGGIWGYTAYKSSDDGNIDYQVAEVERGDLASQVTASGTLSPLVTVQVGSQVSGRILELYADFNSRVEKGKVIARIDPRLFDSDVAKAKANMTAARASVTRAEAELAQARRNNERTSALASKKLVALADADVALAAFQSAAAQVSSARASLSQARAALEQAETNLAYTTIVSPIDGIVISRNVDKGQTVAASLQAPTLFTIAEDLAKMEVHTSVAESDVGRLTQGMEVEFTVDAHPSDKFRGTVKEVRYSPTTLQNVVTYDAVVSVDNADLKLRPGMTADVTFLVEKREKALMVPNAALRFRPPPEVLAQIGWTPPAGRSGATGADGEAAAGQRTARAARAGEARAESTGGASGKRERGGADRASRRLVWKMGKNGLPEAAPVQIGISDGRQTEIVKGLTEGDQIITGVTGAEAAPAEQTPARGGGNRGGGRRGSFL